MFRTIPQLTVKSVKASVAFYEMRLGFKATVVDPPDEPVFATVEREEATLFLVIESSREEREHMDDLAENKRGVGLKLFLEVDDAQELYDSLKEADVFSLTEIAYNEKEDYTEFSFRDPDGYEIGVYS